MGEQAADKIHGGLAQHGITVLIVEDVFPILLEQHMHVHTVAGLAVQGFGHQGGGLAGPHRLVADHILDGHGIVRQPGHLPQLHLDLHLAGAAHLVVVVLDVDAVFGQLQTGLVPDIEVQVKGLVDVVAPVGAAMEAAVGRRVPGAPGRLAGFQGKTHAVGFHLVAQGVEHMVFVFRPDDHLVRNAGLLHVGHGPAGHIAGILGKGAVVGLLDHHYIPHKGQGRDLHIGVHNAGGQVRDEHHVAIVHHGIAIVGTIKADTVLHDALV